MNSLPPLKALATRTARGGMLLSALSVFLSGTATVRAAKDGAPAYYAAYEIPRRMGSSLAETVRWSKP